MAWKDVTGATGICGILPTNDPRAVDARRKYSGISDKQAQFLYRAVHNEPPDGSTRVGSRRISGRRFSPTSRGIRSWKRKRYGDAYWYGAMLDRGANVSASGIGQRDAFSCDFPSTDSALSPLTGGFHTMGGTTKVVGTFALPLPLHVKRPIADSFKTVNVQCLDTDTPMIIGLSDMYALGIQMDIYTNSAALPDGGVWPLCQHNGHLFVKWNKAAEPGTAECSFLQHGECPFTREELAKIHQRSGHPHWRRMHDFLRRVRPEECEPGLLKDLQEMVRECVSCQTYAPKPRVVKLSLPHGTGRFNHEVIVDLFTIDKNLSISVVDRDTRYVSAMFLTGSDALHTWSAILQCWSL
jgi:hypothetical protein